MNYILFTWLLSAVVTVQLAVGDEVDSTQAGCFRNCAVKYPPNVATSRYPACRHGCLLFHYSLDHHVDNEEFYQATFEYCHSSYQNDIGLVEACVFPSKVAQAGSVHSVEPHALTAKNLFNLTAPSKCVGQMYNSIEGPKCMAYMKSWQFNYITMKCEEFVYGGCPEIDNKFESKAQCQAACTEFAKAHANHKHKPASNAQKRTPPKCLSPTYAKLLAMGSLECDQFEEKVQFNLETGMCETFQYSRCTTVNNIFDSMSECLSECSFYTVPPTQPPTTTTTTTPEPTTQKAYAVVTDPVDDWPGSMSGESIFRNINLGVLFLLAIACFLV